MKLRPETETSLRIIMDTFAGADGGVAFYHAQGLIEEMDRRASTGDAAAIQVIKVMTDFARFIETAIKLA